MFRFTERYIVFPSPSAADPSRCSSAEPLAGAAATMLEPSKVYVFRPPGPEVRIRLPLRVLRSRLVTTELALASKVGVAGVAIE